MEPSAATIWAALLLASQLSGLSIDPRQPLPRVIVANQAEGRPIGGHAKFAAVTSGDGRTVTLARDWTGVPGDICILAHEMTHVLQAQHHLQRSCAVLEPPAYRVQQICSTLAGDTNGAAYFASRVIAPVCFE